MSRRRSRKPSFTATHSRAREIAFQIIYQDDLNPGSNPALSDELFETQLEWKDLDELDQPTLLDLAHDVVPGAPRDILERFSRYELISLIRRDSIEFGRSLVSGVRKTRPELDAQIEKAAENWSLSRMAATDRGVLRLGAYELLQTETPERVAIDEAVDLAKRFGTAQSGPFVNGILDRLLRDKNADDGVEAPG